jgi:hypothetical protein
VRKQGTTACCASDHSPVLALLVALYHMPMVSDPTSSAKLVLGVAYAARPVVTNHLNHQLKPGGLYLLCCRSCPPLVTCASCWVTSSRSTWTPSRPCSHRQWASASTR